MLFIFIFITILGVVYEEVRDRYPQNKKVSEYCPPGTFYNRHACGIGVASEWDGDGDLTYGQGPFHTDEYLDSNGHCAHSCDCQEIYVECFLGI